MHWIIVSAAGQTNRNPGAAYPPLSIQETMAHPGQNTSSTHVNTARARESLKEEKEKTLYKFDVQAGTVCVLLRIAN